ncbi:MAG TPA: TolC family protein [Phycisphaerae bacterium]|nr:TolC family protein [Phycisphaerae bacterium]
MRNAIQKMLLCSVALALTACTIHPRGESEERATVINAGKPYEHPIETRTVAPLAPDATPEEMVQYALLTNADVEAQYWQWRSALEQVPQDGTEKTNIAISLTSMITNGSTAWKMTNVGVGNDASANIVLPSKLDTAAKAALENAKAAGLRFDKARYELRNKLLSAYYDYALTAELLRLEEQNQKLLELTDQMVKLRIGTGTSMQQDLLKAGNELESSKNDIASFRAKAAVQLAAINVILNRDPTTPIAIPKTLPAPRPVPGDDAALLKACAESSPELRALQADLAAKGLGIKMAKQEYLPEFGVNATTDFAGITQSILGSVMVPVLRYQAIDAGIRQAEDNLRATAAAAHQFRHELAGRVVTDLVQLREDERQVTFLESTLIPRTRQVVSASQASYGANQSSMLDLLDGQRSQIALQRLAAEMKTDREKQLADLEAAIGASLLPTTNETK